MDAPVDAGNPARRAFIGQALKLGAAATAKTTYHWEESSGTSPLRI